MSDLRSDISHLQDDLKISRKVRKGDKEESVITYLEGLKQKAKQFYESRMFYAVCPDCNMLLASSWFLNPELDNRLILVCKRCDKNVLVNSKDMLAKKGSNKPEVFPESII
jgi:hypothetical protein